MKLPVGISYTTLGETSFYVEVRPVFDTSVRGLCLNPYRNHPKGCPNYGKKHGCPPDCRTLDRLLDLAGPVYAICNRYDLKAHIDTMRRRHPRWTIHQLRCVLYWQPAARKQLRQGVRRFKEAFPALVIVGTPEAAGTNVTQTMANAGLALEWPPQTYAYQIVLAGSSVRQHGAGATASPEQLMLELESDPPAKEGE